LLSSYQVLVQVRGFVCELRNKIRLNGEEFLAPRSTPGWRTTPCWLFATAYSIHSQLPSILEAVPPSATWGRAMPLWQGPTYHMAWKQNTK